MEILHFLSSSYSSYFRRLFLFSYRTKLPNSCSFSASATLSMVTPGLRGRMLDMTSLSYSLSPLVSVFLGGQRTIRLHTKIEVMSERKSQLPRPILLSSWFFCILSVKMKPRCVASRPRQPVRWTKTIVIRGHCALGRTRTGDIPSWRGALPTELPRHINGPCNCARAIYFVRKFA